MVIKFYLFFLSEFLLNSFQTKGGKGGKSVGGKGGKAISGKNKKNPQTKSSRAGLQVNKNK